MKKKRLNLKSFNINSTIFFPLFSLSLEYSLPSIIGIDQTSLPPIRYLQCPAAVTVRHLKRFLSSKFDLNLDVNCRIDIIYEDEILPIDLSMIDVAYCFEWMRVSKFF